MGVISTEFQCISSISSEADVNNKLIFRQGIVNLFPVSSIIES